MKAYLMNILIEHLHGISYAKDHGQTGIGKVHAAKYTVPADWETHNRFSELTDQA